MSESAYEGRCESCRWWEAIAPTAGWGTCSRINGDSETGDPAAWLIDETTLMTTADFGCVMWEPRTDDAGANASHSGDGA